MGSLCAAHDSSGTGQVAQRQIEQGAESKEADWAGSEQQSNRSGREGDWSGTGGECKAYFDTPAKKIGSHCSSTSSFPVNTS